MQAMHAGVYWFITPERFIVWQRCTMGMMVWNGIRITSDSYIIRNNSEEKEALPASMITIQL